jgi:GNAT superfamily N-acetyltransferase
MITRLATPKDAEPISALMHGLSHFFLASPASPEASRFFDSTSPERMRENIAASNRRFYVAEQGNAFAGFISLRDGNHISQFFVPPEFHGRGIGRLLWSAAMATARAADTFRFFTVDSSLFAIPVYERFGFKVVGPQQQHEGLVFVPMELRLNGADASQETPSK